MKAGASYAFAFIYYNHMGYYEKLSSAIYNDIMSGLRGYSSTPTMSLEQLEDDCVDERLQIIKEYFIKGLVPKKDLLMTIPCIEVDCKNIERCRCNASPCDTLTAHFEIPQLLTEFGEDGIEYIGDMYDCFVFNAPLLKKVTVVAILKDPRQLDWFGCCAPVDINNMTFIDAEIKKRLTEKKIRYYRQLAAPVLPNDQVPK